MKTSQNLLVECGFCYEVFSQKYIKYKNTHKPTHVSKKERNLVNVVISQVLVRLLFQTNCKRRRLAAFKLG